MERNEFFYPRGQYRGEATPENVAFDATLQEFAHRVNFIAGLHTGGKLSSQECYDRIKQSWQQVKMTRQELGFGKSRGK